MQFFTSALSMGLHYVGEVQYHINPSALLVNFSHLAIVLLMTKSAKFHPSMIQKRRMITTMSSSADEESWMLSQAFATTRIHFISLSRENSKHVCRKINIFSLWCLIVSVFLIFIFLEQHFVFETQKENSLCKTFSIHFFFFYYFIFCCS